MPTKPRQILESVVSELENDIIFGRLRPFETLGEDALMARFGVKRHVVRQALSSLAAMGIIEKEAGRSARVRFFSAVEVEQIYAIRNHLHLLAIKTMPLPATDQEIAELKRYQKEHRAAIEAGDLRAAHVANDHFHAALFGCCGNPYLLDAIRHYEWLSNPIRSYGIADRKIMDQSSRDHADMIAAIIKKDRRRLMELVEKHVIPGKLVYLASIEMTTRLAGGRAPTTPPGEPPEKRTRRRPATSKRLPRRSTGSSRRPRRLVRA